MELPKISNNKVGRAFEFGAEIVGKMLGWILLVYAVFLHDYNLKVGNDKVASTGLWALFAVMCYGAYLTLASPLWEEQATAKVANYEESTRSTALSNAKKEKDLEDAGVTKPVRTPQWRNMAVLSVNADSVTFKFEKFAGATALKLKWNSVGIEPMIADIDSVPLDGVSGMMTHTIPKSSFGAAWVAGGRINFEFHQSFPDERASYYRGPGTVRIPQ